MRSALPKGPTSLLLLPFLFTAVSAQTIVLEEGEDIVGETIENIGEVLVNDRGDWVANITYDDPVLGQATHIVLKNGSIVVRAGQALDPPGVQFISPTYLHLDNHGNVGGLYLLTGAGPSRGVYMGTELWLAQGATTNLSQFDPGSTYSELNGTKLEDNGSLLLNAKILEPGAPTSLDVLVRLTRSGGTTFEELVVAEGDARPGGTVSALFPGPTWMATNDLEDVLYQANLAGGSTTLFMNDIPLATVGAPAPVPGRNYLFLQGELVLNENREWAYRATLDGDPETGELLVVNGSKFVQLGDSLPAIAPQTIQLFGPGPVYFSNSREVLWWGAWWEDANEVLSDAALFIGDEPLVREESTVIAGQLLTKVRFEQKTFHMSRNGHHVVFRGELEDGIERMFLVDRGTRAYAEMRNGTHVNPLCMRMLSTPVQGSVWLVGVESFAAPGTTMSFVVATGGPRTGPVVPAGELLIDVALPVLFSSTRASAGFDVHTIPVPAIPALIGFQAHAQGLLMGPGGFTFCNALDPVIGN